HAGVAQRVGARRFIQLSEIDDGACAGEGVGNNRLTPLAQLEGDDERWSAQLHDTMKISATRLMKPQQICLIDRRVKKIGRAQWRLESGSWRPSSAGWRRDQGRNARGPSLRSIPLLIWSAHETGSQRRNAESTTTAAAIPPGDARA